MTAHLFLLCCAATAATRAAAFAADDEPLDPEAAEALPGLRGRLPYSDRQFASSAFRAGETASALGLAAAVRDPALAECDFGRWRGQTLEAVQQAEPQALAAWLQDPAQAPHGGESFVALTERARSWLAARAAEPGVALAVTHASVIRAAVVIALEAGPKSFWRIDVAPLTLARLSGRAGRWNLVGLGPLAGS